MKTYTPFRKHHEHKSLHVHRSDKIFEQKLRGQMACTFSVQHTFSENLNFFVTLSDGSEWTRIFATYVTRKLFFFPSMHTNPRMKIHIFWDFSPYRLVNSYRRFGDQKCLHIQCKANQLQGQAFNVWLKQSKRTLKYLIHCLSKRLELLSSRQSVTFQPT